MPTMEFFKYAREIPAVQAEENMMWINVVSYPHLKDSGRRSVDQQLRRQSQVDVHKPASQEVIDQGWDILRKHPRGRRVSGRR